MSKEEAAEAVSDGEEHEDDERHDHRDEPDHREKPRLVLVHSVEARRAVPARARSATREIEPVASTAPSDPASSRARRTAARGSVTSSIGGGSSPATCRASDSSVAGGSARGLALLVSTTAAQHGRSSRSM